MAARYVITQHVYCPAVGAPILMHEGAQHDSLHPAVVANPSLFSASVPVLGTGHINPSLAQYLVTYKSGPEL